MTVHLRRDIDDLKRRLLSYSASVEETLAKSIRALTTRDSALAEEIVQADRVLDREEVSIEEDCLKILALYQPVAADLRFVVAVLKMNNDLERMGDLAANIAKRAKVLAEHPALSTPVDFQTMADLAMTMVKQSLDSLVNGDPKLARQVCADDDKLDDMRRQAHRHLMNQIKAAPEQIEPLMAMNSAYRHLERIGDMATNVCEDVIYMIEGDIIRHNEGE